MSFANNVFTIVMTAIASCATSFVKCVNSLDVACTQACPTTSVTAVNPQAIVDFAIRGAGGEERLRDVHSLHYEGIGHWYVPDGTSQPPERPPAIAYEHVDEWVDFDEAHVKTKGLDLTPEQHRAGAPTHRAESRHRLLSSPPRLLLAAKAASDLKSIAAPARRAAERHVVAFHLDGSRVRLEVDRATGLLTAAEVTDGVRDRFEFAAWTREASGLSYPHQTNVHRNGRPFHTLVLTKLDINPDASSFVREPQSELHRGS